MKIYIKTSRGGRIKKGFYLYVLEAEKEDGTVVSKSNLGTMKPVEDTTEARLALMALTEAIGHIKVDKFVDVDIDVGSRSIFQAFQNGWYKRWAEREFEDIKNADLWKMYREEANKRPRCSFRLTEPGEYNSYSSWLEFNLKKKEGKATA